MRLRVFSEEVDESIVPAAAAAPLTPLGLTPAVSEQPNETTLLKTLKAALGKRDAPV